MKFVHSFCVILLLIGAVSCNYRRVTLYGTPATDYHHTQKKLTRYQKIYGLEKVIFDTRVVYFDHDLRLKYVDEYADLFRLSVAEKDALLQQELADDAAYDDFYIAHFSSERGYQNLQENVEDKKIWTLRLVDDTSELRPLSITPLKRTNHQEYFFPIMDHFSKLYKVRFRKSTSTTKTLSMYSPARSTTFEWK